MAKITSFDVVPLRIPFQDGSAGVGLMPTKWTHLDFALVRLQSEDGLVGWGDAFAYNCRTAVCAALEDMVKPLILGLDVEPTSTWLTAVNEELQKRLHLHGRYGITTFAISAVDIALWDLAAKQAGQSLATFLGGAKRAELPAYASLVRYTEPDLVARFCEQAAQEGYKSVKLHEITVPAIQKARETLGQDMALMTDVNCNWSVAEARDILPEMKNLGLYWVEEPVFPPDDAETLAKFEADFGVAMASGENACTAVEFARIVPWITFPQPSVTKVGGVTEFIKVCDLAVTHRKTVMPHAPYFGPGYWATIQIMAARPECRLFERFFVWPELHLSQDIPLPVDGTITVPDGLGLGFEPDEDVIARFRV
ncbi:MAG: mandelate racemase/muconate lactonizing enzyme family protein [Pseudomonadota bacterium]